MRPESLKRAGRNAALTVGAVGVLSLLSFAPWNTDQHPAQAQDVLGVPDVGSNGADARTATPAPINPAFLNMFSETAQPIAGAVPMGRPVQAPMPEPAKLNVVAGLAEPLVATVATTPEQDSALQAAVNAFLAPQEDANAPADFAAAVKPFTEYLAANPSSPYALALQTNLGLGYYNAGYFTQAIAAYEQAWAAGKNSTVPEAKRLADRAVGELARMRARIGQVDELATLFAAIGERKIEGAATEFIAGAAEGLDVMRNDPGIAFLCGPKALMNVLLAQGATPEQVAIADAARSGSNGVSLPELDALATKAGLTHTLIKRAAGQPIPVPSVIHWKLNHYAAITAEEDGRFTLQDPTFAGGPLTLTHDAIEAESSGYFLVPAAARKVDASAPSGMNVVTPGQPAPVKDWRVVDPKSDEAKAVYGRGFASSHNPDNTHGCCASTGQMAVASAHMTVVSLTVSDPPTGYRTAKGPGVQVRLSYHQREATQPANIPFFNIGQKWVLDQQAYMYETQAGSRFNTKRYVGGGGAVNSYGILSVNSGGNNTTIYTRDVHTGERLQRVPWDGAITKFELLRPDGGKLVYSHSEGAAAGTPNRVFLKEVVDAQGLKLTYNYTNLTGTQGPITCSPVCVRLDSITDADGKVTTFSYELTSYPLLVTKVTDPFGRFSTITYDASQRVSTITDPIGITSTMAYDGSGLVNGLTTPYGTSSFSYGQASPTDPATQRWLTLTDALGNSRRLEFRHSAPGIATTVPAGEVPTGMNTLTNANHYRNGFLWDEHVSATVGTGNYTQATIYHWNHDARYSSFTSTSLESLKRPLENRVWFNYPPQLALNAAWSGSLIAPSATGRVLDDGTSQVTKAEYTTDTTANVGKGQLLSQTDALGRKSKFTYSNLDLTKIEQQISATPTWATLAQFTYNSAHQILTATDAANQVWRYAYNSAGQMIYATNPLNETRFWEYDASARLTRVTVPVAVAHASVVYGTTNLTAATAQSLNYTAACSGVTAPANTNLPISVTDSEGYEKCYEYDALDRIVKVKHHDGTFDQYDYTFPAGLASQPTWTTGTVPTAGSPSLDVWKITDRLGRITNYVYDRNRRITSSSETVTVAGSAVTRTTSYSYYANGVLKELTDANGNVTRWDIDLQSRPTAKTYAYGTANAKTESYTYDITGRLKTRTDARNQTVTYTYNKDDTVASYAFTNAVVATPGASFVYDPWFPRRTSMTDQFGTTTWTYKPVGTNGALLPDVEDGPFANDSITLAYDAAGRPNSRTISGTAAETFGFDTLGRMNSHVTELGSFTYGYLGNSGQVASRAIGGITTSWGYDTNANDRRLLTISTTGAVARNFTYTSNAYQITGITDTAPGTHPWLSQTWSFTHDAGDRLLTGNGTIAGNHSYSLDKLDNATSFAGLTGTYNNLNQISTFNTQTYAYDANGNLSSDGTRTYTHDAADRLVTITLGGTTVTFAYDGLGRRLKQTVGATETRYLWCGIVICQQRNGSDTAEKRFYSEGEYVHSGTKKYLTLADHLGSVRDVIDITGTPTLVGSFDYRPYGEVARSWGTVTTGYTYAGLFAQTNTGLLLSTTRAYNPANGKWLNVDPIRETGGVNLTGYVGGNPLNVIDIAGLKGSFWGCLAACVADQYGLNLASLISGIGAIPVKKSWIGVPTLPGASRHTNIISWLGFEIFPGWNISRPIMGSVRIFGIIGRLNPYVLGALLITDGVMVGLCMANGGPS